MRRLLTDLLKRELARYTIQATGEAGEVLNAVDSGRVGIVVLDVRLAYGEVVGLVQRLKANAPSTPLVLLVDEMGSRYREATGADACVEKRKIVDELPALVSRLANRALTGGLTYPERNIANNPFSGDRSVRADVRDGRPGHEDQ
jgi:DNA-binding NtrC family response regulator